jgi:hypothetical protein
MLAKKNVRLLFYRMCYHYSLEEEQKPFERGIKNGNKIFKKENQISFSKIMQILGSYSRLN